MTVNSVTLTTPSISNVQSNTFKGSKDAVSNNRLTGQEEPKNRKKELALALGALAIAGIAAAAIISHKGKTPESIGIKEFKKAGSFDKGFATFKNKPYTGTIKTKNAEITYKEGVMQSSLIYNLDANKVPSSFFKKEDEALKGLVDVLTFDKAGFALEKKYSYNEAGKLKAVDGLAYINKQYFSTPQTPLKSELVKFDYSSLSIDNNKIKSQTYMPENHKVKVRTTEYKDGKWQKAVVSEKNPCSKEEIAKNLQKQSEAATKKSIFSG